MTSTRVPIMMMLLVLLFVSLAVTTAMERARNSYLREQPAYYRCPFHCGAVFENQAGCALHVSRYCAAVCEEQNIEEEGGDNTMIFGDDDCNYNDDGTAASESNWINDDEEEEGGVGVEDNTMVFDDDGCNDDDGAAADPIREVNNYGDPDYYNWPSKFTDEGDPSLAAKFLFLQRAEEARLQSYDDGVAVVSSDEEDEEEEENRRSPFERAITTFLGIVNEW